MGETYQFQAKDKSFLLGQRTWLIGVVNVTPDSFYDGGFYFDQVRAIERGLILAAEGADVIDIGGESTRPGSDPVPADEERKRVLPVISALKEKTEALISIDTTKAEVAEAAIVAGASIVNDISAGRFDPLMFPLVSGSGAGLILIGVNVARTQLGIRLNKITLFIGIIAILFGGASILGYELPLLATIIILIGLFIIAEAAREIKK